MTARLLEFDIKSDARGSLVAIEENKDIPFKIKRVYYIFAAKSNVVRGKHAHKNLQQALICTSGSCKVLVDSGREKKEYFLSDPGSGLVISNMLWREMYDFSADCTLMVLASDHYNESEYIRDYGEFLNEVKKQSKIY